MSDSTYNTRRSVTVSTDGASVTIQDLSNPILTIAPPSPSVVALTGVGTLTIFNTLVLP